MMMITNEYTKAVVAALKAFPYLNAEIQGDEVLLKHYYDIGIAVSTEEGLVVPDAPLPEGARVEIVMPDTPPEVPPELQIEFDSWDRASAHALDLVERLAREDKKDEPR